VSSYTRHKCFLPRQFQSVFDRGCALAVERAPFIAPMPVLALPFAENAAAVPLLEPGWARAVATVSEKLDEAVVVHLTRWFDDGERSRKTKCSAAVAIQRLVAMRDSDGALLFDEETLPDEARVKRFFGTLSKKRKDALRESAAMP
jgi:hypothetical protein